MRKILLSFAAAAALMAAPAAYADGDLYVDVDHDKDIVIREAILLDVDVRAIVDVASNPTKFAESLAFANQRNQNNEACGNCAEKTSLVTGSGNGNSGTVSVNQATGNMNNQGTMVSAAIDDTGPPPPPPPPPVPTPDPAAGFAHAQASADQINQDNTIETVNLLFRDAIIEDSLNGNSGNVFANQAAGNINNQLNVLSLAFSARTVGVALSEAALGQEVRRTEVAEGQNLLSGLGVAKSARLANSLNGNTGVIQVNQSAGNGGNQGNVLTLAALALGPVPSFRAAQ